MKLKTVKNSLVMANEYPGLLKSRVEYQISGASASLEWLGPKIDKIEWAKVLAYFRWTNDQCHSESQVRFYLHVAERRWVAWAFPQKANTGMSSQELDTPDAHKQREQFPDGTWQYLMTVHHHCSGGAFQSSTDERNEHDQDGLHITIGCIDKVQHDMHARFYLAKNCYDPDMSLFWDIGDVGLMTPASVHDVIARYQMCRHIEAEFPQVWKENYIEVKGVYTGTSGVTFRGPTGEWKNGAYFPNQTAAQKTPPGSQGMGKTGENPPRHPVALGPISQRAEDAYNTLLSLNYDEHQLEDMTEHDYVFIDQQLFEDVQQVLYDYELNMHNLLNEIRWQRNRADVRMEEAAADKADSDPNGQDPRKKEAIPEGPFDSTGYGAMME